MKFAFRRYLREADKGLESQQPFASRGTNHNKVNGFAFDLDHCLIDFVGARKSAIYFAATRSKAHACVVQTHDAGMDWDDILRRPGTNPRAAQRAVTGHNRRVLKSSVDAGLDAIRRYFESLQRPLR